MPAYPTLRHREKSQNLMHDTSTLVGLEKKLSVRGTLQNDQFFRLWSFLVLSADAWKPKASPVGIIARNDE